MSNLRYDGHVHLVGNGKSGSGCWLRVEGLWHRFLGEIMRRTIGLGERIDDSNFDSAYVAHLISLMKSSSLDHALLLAQDEVYEAEGRRLNFGSFFVPNDYLFEICRRHNAFLPAVSIHPGRKDAMAELERCLVNGARALKLLPNCQNVDCSDNRFDSFWRLMAKERLPLLSHTGGELTVPVFESAYEDPRILRRPLELGVTVIAAHGASSSHFFDRNYISILFSMMGEFPRLYADTSALNSPFRSAIYEPILKSRYVDRFIHGSDYPVPVSAIWPLLRRKISITNFQVGQGIKNLIERDAYLKKSIGFSISHFTRLEEILRPV